MKVWGPLRLGPCDFLTFKPVHSASSISSMVTSLMLPFMGSFECSCQFLAPWLLLLVSCDSLFQFVGLGLSCDNHLMDLEVTVYSAFFLL